MVTRDRVEVITELEAIGNCDHVCPSVFFNFSFYLTGIHRGEEEVVVVVVVPTDKGRTIKAISMKIIIHHYVNYGKISIRSHFFLINRKVN